MQVDNIAISGLVRLVNKLLTIYPNTLITRTPVVDLMTPKISLKTSYDTRCKQTSHEIGISNLQVKVKGVRL